MNFETPSIGGAGGGDLIPLPAGIEDAMLNLGELAVALDVSTTTVQHWVKEPDFPIITRGASGREYQFQLSAVWDYRERKAQAEAAAREKAGRAAAQMRLAIVGGDADGAGDLTLTAKERAEEFKAAREFIELGRMRGLFVSTQQVVHGVERVLATFRNHVDRLADRLEQDAGLTADQVIVVQTATDDALRECERALSVVDLSVAADDREAS